MAENIKTCGLCKENIDLPLGETFYVLLKTMRFFHKSCIFDEKHKKKFIA